MLRSAVSARDLAFTGCSKAAGKRAVEAWQVLVYEGGVWTDDADAETPPRSAVRGRGTTVVVERWTKWVVRYDCRYPLRGVRHERSVMFGDKAASEWPSGRCGAFVMGGRRLWCLGQAAQYGVVRGEWSKFGRTEYLKAVRSVEDDAALCFGGGVRFEVRRGSGAFWTVVVADGTGLLEANSGARRLLRDRDPRMVMKGGAAHFAVLGNLAWPCDCSELDPGVPRGFPGADLLRGRLEAEHKLLWGLHQAGVLEAVFGPGAAALFDKVVLSQAERRAKAAAELLPPSSYPPCIRRGLGLNPMPLGRPPRNLERYVAASSVCAALRASGVGVEVIFSGELLAAMLAGLRRFERDERTASAREKKFLRMLGQLGKASNDAKELGCRRIARETSLCPYGGDGSVGCHGVIKPSAACGDRGEKRPAPDSG